MLNLEEAIDRDRVVVTTVKDKVYIGKIVAVEDGVYVVRTGKRGRPPLLTFADFKKIEVAA